MYNPKYNPGNYAYKGKNIKRIPLDVQRAEYEQIKAAADGAGLPVNTWIKNALRAALGDGAGPAGAGDGAGAAPGEDAPGGLFVPGVAPPTDCISCPIFNGDYSRCNITKSPLPAFDGGPLPDCPIRREIVPPGRSGAPWPG